MQDHVGERDLFDGAPLALDDDDVPDADRLCDRELDVCEECCDRFLCCEFEYDVGDVCGRE